MRDAGFDPITVQQKYLSDLAWSNFIRTKYGKKFDNIESQIDDELARLEANVTKPQLRLAEIVLTPDPLRDLADKEPGNGNGSGHSQRGELH